MELNNFSGSAQNAQASNNVQQSFYFHGDDVSSRVFLRRRYVFAMVNEHPQTDGHVLICPVRQVRSMRDLTELEYLELFTCAREVAAKFLKKYTSVSSFTFVMHDGELAGTDSLGGLCLQAIPCNSRGEVQASNSNVNREKGEMEEEARQYMDLFENEKNGLNGGQPMRSTA